MKPNALLSISFWSVLAMLLFGTLKDASATHIAGADLTYDCLGGNQYEIELVIYRDCAGINVANNEDVTISSQNLGVDFDINVSLINNTGQEITNPCNSNPSVCDGGSAVGIQEWIYRGTVTLPQPATDWVFSFRRNARNTAITTVDLTTNSQGAFYTPGSTGPYTYVEATLDNVNAPCNTSPDFSNEPITFFCVNQGATYNQGVVDIDGDSLVYSIIPPKDDVDADLVYNAPFSYLTPLNGNPSLAIDPQTGNLTVTPTSLQISVLAVLVEEYRNGQLIGSVIRDIQVYVTNCQNILPSASGIDGSNDYSTTVCAGQNICFDINSIDPDQGQNVTLNWNQGIPGANFTVSSSARPTGVFCWTPTANDINKNNAFTVTVQDDACPSNGTQTFAYTINVEGLSVVDLGPDVNKCAALDTLSPNVSGSSGPYSYDWSTGESSSSIVVNSSGAYAVTVTTPNGCTKSDTINVQLSQSGSLDLIAWEDTTICGGSSLVLDAGPGFNVYQWSNGDQGQVTTVNSSGVYSVTATDNIGCQNFDTVTVNLFPAPNVDLGPDQSFCQGRSAVLDAGSGFADYNWSTGAATTDITVNSSGNYSVTVTDANGCQASDDVNITVNSTPSVSLGPDKEICQGDTTTFSVFGNYTSIQWSNGATSNIISVSDAGTYSVTVTNGNGCVASDTAELGLKKIPFVELGPDLIVCKKSFTLSVPLGGKGTTYQWSNGSTRPFIVVNSSGNYGVTVTNSNGCAVSDDITIRFSNINNQPLFANNQLELCEGDTVTLDPGAGFLSYDWTTGATTQTIDVNTSGVYGVSVEDTLGCKRTDEVDVAFNAPPQFTLGPDQEICDGDTANLAVNGNFSSYLWSTGETTASIQTNTAGAYSVTVEDQFGCSSSDTVEVFFRPLPSVNLGPDTSICNSGLLVLNATISAPNASYQWSTGDVSPSITVTSGGNYAVTVNDGFGCENSDDINVNVNPSPAVNLGPNREICQGDTAVLSASGSNIAYIWSTGATTQSIAVTAAGIYNVTVTDANGCQNSGSVQVIVNPLPNVGISSPDTICAGFTTTLSAAAGFNSYVWSTGDTTQSIDVSQAGTYSVTVTDANGCSNSDATSVTVAPEPQVNITGVDTLCIGSALSLSTSGQFATYAWSNGETGASTNITSAGLYSVTVTDGNGCEAADTVEIVEEACCLPANFGPSFTNINASNNIISTNTVWDGKYYVSENVFVRNGAILDLTNVDIVFLEGKGIIFEDSSRVRANNSVFRPCDIDKTWAGFDFTDNSSGVINESLFKNAEVAVDVSSSDAVALTNNQFSNFAIGVQLRSAGGNAYDEGISGNTFVSNDQRPEYTDTLGNVRNSFFAIKLYDSNVSALISQNDFVNQSLSSNPAFEYHGIYSNSSSLVASKNTFSNMYRAFDLTGASAAVTFRNNEIEYSEQSYTDIYPIRITDRNASPVLLEGNTLDYSQLASNGTNQEGIYVFNVRNLIIADNTIKGFDRGIRIQSSNTVVMDRNEISDARQNGIRIQGSRNLEITANYLHDMENIGIFSFNCRSNVEIMNNSIDMNDYSNTNGIRFVIRNGVYNAPSVKIHSNCVRNVSTALSFRSLGTNNTRTIPYIYNNYLYNYEDHGLWNINFLGQIGSCNNMPDEVGKNSFISNYLPPYGNAVDVRSDNSVLYLAGNSENLMITFPNVIVITGCNTTSTASCGNQIGNNEFEGKTSTGYLAQYENFNEFIEAKYPLELSGANYQLSNDYLAVVEALEVEERKDFALSVLNILNENASGNTAQQFYSAISSANLLNDNDQKWLAYAYHNMNADYQNALQTVQSIDVLDQNEADRVEIAKIEMQLKIDERSVVDLNASELDKLALIDIRRDEYAAVARDLIQAATGEHDYIFEKADEADLEDVDAEEEQSGIQLDNGFVKVFPNPVENQLQVHYNTKSDSENITIRISNTLGQTMDQRKVQFNNGQESFDVSNFAQGVYIINIFDDENILRTTKFIKSK